MASIPDFPSFLHIFSPFRPPSFCFSHLSGAPRLILHDCCPPDQELTLQQPRCAIRGICVMTVFSAESSNPRSLMNCSTRGLTSCSRSSFELPVTQKSSAYRIRFTLAFFPSRLVFEKWEERSRSSPSSVIFAIAGEMMPPWGVPSSGVWKHRRSTYPALSHFLSMAFSIVICATNH